MTDSFRDDLNSLRRIDAGSTLQGELHEPSAPRDPERLAYMAELANPCRPAILGQALGPEDYERLAEKVKTLKVPDYWCEAKGECACCGCANGMLTWTELECWLKYGPEFNRTRVAE
ncbi:hypothetical protein [Pseudomonas aeruginosa]|uniref:hypothetical protein n=1 Tax=Pseudomonas aeruginosa TaxID=287 RepID=UPI0034E07436